MSVLQFVYGDSVLTVDDLEEFPGRVVVDDHFRQGRVLVFKTEEEFCAWAITTKYAPSVGSALNLIRLARDLDDDIHDAAMPYQQKKVRQLNEEIQALHEQTKQPYSSRPFIDSIMKGETVLHGPISNFTMLFDSPNTQGLGLVMPLNLPLPNFNWFNFDNKASSAVVIGGCFLFQKKRFKGNWCFAATLTPTSEEGVSPFVVDLRDLQFDNIASSGIHM